MTSLIKDLVKYRLDRAIETIEEAVLLANNNHWNACINRLYYACFYATNVLLIKQKKIKHILHIRYLTLV